MNAILAIDGGATHTRAGLYDEAGNLLAETEGEGTNPWDMGEEAVATTVSELATDLAQSTQSELVRIVAGIAGAGVLTKATKLADRIAWHTGIDRVSVTSDLLMLFHANCSADSPALALAGTGSSVAARDPGGNPVTVGGLGHLVDDGSAYRIAIQAIKRGQDDDVLRARLIEAAGLESFDQFVWWLRLASPSDVAALARPIFSLAATGNESAAECLLVEAMAFAHQVLRALKKSHVPEPTNEHPCTALTHGGVFEHSPLYAEIFAHSLQYRLPHLIVAPVPVVGHAAAFSLSQQPSLPDYVKTNSSKPSEIVLETERAESGLHIDQMDDDLLFINMESADAVAATCVSYAQTRVLRAIDTAAACLRAGGRIIYAGAGTSGRLGVLDAAECPPTFGVEEDRVIALIAGGDAALRHSIEGAEDDTEAAARDLDAIDPPLGPNDLVIGITASGTTPYAIAAIDRARELGATTALLCCNPVPLDRADMVIALDTGPEVLPGSTRLKAGTATKMVLNQISTGAMAKAGYVFEGRMVGVRPLNKKLRQRCIRIIAELTGESGDRAEQRLDETGGSVRLAVLMARKNLSLDEATRRLDAAHGILRDALEEA